MYRIIYDGQTLHDPRTDTEVVTDCVCNLEVNTSGSLKFKLAPNHPLYGKLVAKNVEHEVILLDEDYEIFRGRITDESEDMQTRTSFTCEGQLAYLNDVKLRPYGTYADISDPPQWTTIISDNTERNIFEWYIQQYNSKVDENKQFSIAENELDSTLITRSSTQWPIVSSEIKDKILSPIGGWLFARYEDGKRILSIYKTTHDSSQIIDFGENLTDFASTRSTSDIVTAIIPKGKTDTGLEFGIESAEDAPYGDGCVIENDRMIYTLGANKYGVIEDKRSYDSALTVHDLLGYCYQDLITSSTVIESITIKAIDLSHYLGEVSIPIRYGDWVRIRSKPHGVDQFMMCLGISIDVNSPDKTIFTFGATLPTLSNSTVLKQNQSRKQIEELISSAASISDEAKKAAQAAGKAIISSTDEYAISTSSIVAPTSGWSTATPSWTAGHYIWRRVVDVYGDGSTTTSSPALLTGNPGVDGPKGDSAISIKITSSNGNIFKQTAISTVLTAHVYKGPDELSGEALAAVGIVKWYKNNSTTSIGTGVTLTISEGDALNKDKYIVQLEG